MSDEELRRTYLQLDERVEREEELEGLRNHDPLGLHDDLSDNEHDPLTDEAPGDFLSGQDFVPGRHCPVCLSISQTTFTPAIKCTYFKARCKQSHEVSTVTVELD